MIRRCACPPDSAIQSIVGLCFLITLLRPIKPPTHITPAKRLRLHRSFCKTFFFFLLIAVVIHPMPGIMYTIFTHRASPEFGLVGRARTIALIVTLLIGGSMRRGPKMKYQPLAVSIGFGVNADQPSSRLVTSGKGDGKGDDQFDVSNVLDWSNCSFLAFIFLFYVSRTQLICTSRYEDGPADQLLLLCIRSGLLSNGLHKLYNSQEAIFLIWSNTSVNLDSVTCFGMWIQTRVKSSSPTRRMDWKPHPKRPCHPSSGPNGPC